VNASYTKYVTGPCISQGLTKEEAIRNIKEAIEAYTLALKDQGLPIPVIV
jgi:predicted RNase H-like HicB family nuclease